jgi:hypothetical protein
MTMMRMLLIALALSMLAAGCAQSQFQIVRPEKLQMRIGEASQRVETPNMVYNMLAKENRLVILIYNSRPNPVYLLGQKSSIVDPKGASHPLRSMTIAPNSYAKLIMPPLRPRFETTPQWQFGVGVGTQVSDSAAGPAAKPLYMDSFEDADAFYWDWDGPRPVRLTIVYSTPDGKEFSDEFSFEKVSD